MAAAAAMAGGAWWWQSGADDRAQARVVAACEAEVARRAVPAPIVVGAVETYLTPGDAEDMAGAVPGLRAGALAGLPDDLRARMVEIGRREAALAPWVASVGLRHAVHGRRAIAICEAMVTEADGWRGADPAALRVDGMTAAEWDTLPAGRGRP